LFGLKEVNVTNPHTNCEDFIIKIHFLVHLLKNFQRYMYFLNLRF